MKKIWKVMFAAAMISIAVCLFAGTAVFAETVSGELAEGCVWEVNTETGTLTITGTNYSWMTYPEFMEKDNWSAYESEIEHIYLDGLSRFSESYAMSNVKSAAGQYGSISWEMTDKTLRVNGTGVASGMVWDAFVDLFAPCEVILGDQITGWAANRVIAQTLHIGADYSSEYFPGGFIIASPDNPYYSTYEGSVYTKGFTKLLYYAGGTFHPDIKIIGTGSCRGLMNETLVLPWGLTTIEDDAFVIAGYRPTVIIPDTVTSMQQNHAGGKDCSVIFTYSKSNTAVANVIGGKTDYFDRPISNPVDSLAEYYPDHVKPSEPEPTTPSSEPSSQPTESKPEPSKPAESSKSAESSQTASKPAEPSKPAESVPTVSKPIQPSKPVENSQAPSVSSSEPVSSAPESSAPAETSLPAEDEPSSESDGSELESGLPEESEVSEADIPADKPNSSSWPWPVFLILAVAALSAAVLLFVILKKGKK